MHPHGPRREGLTYFQGFLLVALVLAAYWPAVHGGFILDDDVFLTRNPLIHAADGLRRFWCTTQAADYWPLTSTSLWLEWRLWGMNPTGYHLTNLCLHAAECLLLWRLLVRLEVPGAYLCSLVFAVHPLNVESVAWITQRKGLMAMLFFLLSIDATLSAEGARLRGARASGNAWYLASLGAYVLALVSKASVAPLPLVLYGLIAWSRRPTLGGPREARSVFCGRDHRGGRQRLVSTARDRGGLPNRGLGGSNRGGDNGPLVLPLEGTRAL